MTLTFDSAIQYPDAQGDPTCFAVEAASFNETISGAGVSVEAQSGNPIMLGTEHSLMVTAVQNGVLTITGSGSSGVGLETASFPTPISLLSSRAILSVRSNTR